MVQVIGQRITFGNSNWTPKSLFINKTSFRKIYHFCYVVLPKDVGWHVEDT
jgi:hypothetical protein